MPTTDGSPSKCDFQYRIAEHNHGIRARAIPLAGQQGATDRGLEAERGEKVAADVVRHQPVGPAIDAQAVEADLIGDDVVEVCRALFADLAILGHGELVLHVAVPLLERQFHEAFRMGDRQRPQQDPRHHAEDGGVGADAERQGQRRDARESGAFEEQPQPVGDVLPERVHDRMAGRKGRPGSSENQAAAFGSSERYLT